MIRTVLILFLIGTITSAQQVSSGVIIDCGEREIDLEALAGAGTGFSIDAGMRHAVYPVDTLETFDIELDEKKERNIYREIAVVVIVAAMVGYMVIQLINPGDEEEASEPDGKDIPGLFLRISVPFTP